MASEPEIPRGFIWELTRSLALMGVVIFLALWAGAGNAPDGTFHNQVWGDPMSFRDVLTRRWDLLLAWGFVSTIVVAWFVVTRHRQLQARQKKKVAARKRKRDS